MNIDFLIKALGQTQSNKKVSEILSQGSSVNVSSVVGSGVSMLISNVFRNENRKILFISSNQEEAAYVLNDLEYFLKKEQVFYFPSSYRYSYEAEKIDNANVLLRAEMLNQLANNPSPLVVTTHFDALLEKVMTKKELHQKTKIIRVGDFIPLEEFTQTLFDYNFERVDFVTEPGEFSVRGGIVDVFSFSNDTPYRIEFFDSEVESIRIFDVESQLSESKVQQISILPNVEDKLTQLKRENILHIFDENTLVFVKDFDLLQKRLNLLYAKILKEYLRAAPPNAIPVDEIFCSGDEFLQELTKFQLVKIYSDQSAEISFAQREQPSFNKSFEILIGHLQQSFQEGFTNYICCVSEQQVLRFQEIFKEFGQNVPCKLLVQPLYWGFTDVENKINCYTDHQILERYHKYNIRNGYAKKQAITLKELNQLEMGDYVTHIDYGIGRFAGLEKISVGDKMQESIKLVYAEGDILYVGIHSLYKISKYNGKDGKAPKIYKLGSNAWKALKQKTKSRVKEIAFNLIKLYAKRKEALGYAYPPDSFLQKELEASFLYEDTPDQFNATIDVKNDMQSPRPMDRLICGDVGFGKTEVAVRAAFKAVDNSKQVAILVPTTILAFQHYKTFSQRMKNFPVRIEYLNRFRSAKEKKEILNDLSLGKIDILIGTHQIVNQNVTYKDLGLLIVDEEQKFGVGVKDKLKTLKENLDVLTLTATPIPRTLQFSLMAARDLSVISTPPPNRYPIESQVIRFSKEIIRDAISNEIQRGGQVFFIHNRVQNIREVAGMIQSLVPDAKIGIGHGQMQGKDLEEVMLAFMNAEFDVLVATTIIESGLDVPNANTIFINDAQNFGLSDLHQMRGRVGRSNKKAFCYFITPPYTALTQDARKRIGAISQFSELGSGFNIAMKDLEIRGAGDLLGGEQSGFINDIGFDTYQKILQEAITELKQNEFSGLYEQQEEKQYLSDTQIDTDFELLFPDNYINSVAERLSLYNRLSKIKTLEELKVFEENLIDRFGKLPPQAQDLLISVRLKWIATRIGIEKLVMKNTILHGIFISDEQSEFYETEIFSRVLEFVQKHSEKCKMVEKKTAEGVRLLLIFREITSVEKALRIFQFFED